MDKIAHTAFLHNDESLFIIVKVLVKSARKDGSGKTSFRIGDLLPKDLAQAAENAAKAACALAL